MLLHHNTWTSQTVGVPIPEIEALYSVILFINFSIASLFVWKNMKSVLVRFSLLNHLVDWHFDQCDGEM